MILALDMPLQLTLNFEGMPGFDIGETNVAHSRDPKTGRFLKKSTIALHCEFCGSAFATASLWRLRSNRHYCSAKCYHAAQRGVFNSRWRGGKSSFVCMLCKEPFASYACLGAPGKEPQFCSKSCYHNSLRKFASPAEQKRDGNRRAGARKRAAQRGMGSHTREEWLRVLKAAGGRCVYCGSRDRVERDHIIPLSKGGSDLITNIQPLCKRCNSGKCDKRTQLL